MYVGFNLRPHYSVICGATLKARPPRPINKLSRLEFDLSMEALTPEVEYLYFPQSIYYILYDYITK